jgi:hypothetical protein
VRRHCGGRAQGQSQGLLSVCVQAALGWRAAPQRMPLRRLTLAQSGSGSPAALVGPSLACREAGATPNAYRQLQQRTPYVRARARPRTRSLSFSLSQHASRPLHAQTRATNANTWHGSNVWHGRYMLPQPPAAHALRHAKPAPPISQAMRPGPQRDLASLFPGSASDRRHPPPHLLPLAQPGAEASQLQSPVPPKPVTHPHVRPGDSAAGCPPPLAIAGSLWRAASRLPPCPPRWSPPTRHSHAQLRCAQMPPPRCAASGCVHGAGAWFHRHGSVPAAA